MARPQKFTRDEVLDAAAAEVQESGRRAGIAPVAARIGAPTGSIYHRFASREELFVALWVRSVQRFHRGFLAALDVADPYEAVTRCVRHTIRYCREHPAEARALTLYRYADLLEDPPEALRADLATLNDAAMTALTGLCPRRYPRVTAYRETLVQVAVRDTPYGLVRPYVGEVVPDWLDDVAVAAAHAILALGDGDGGQVAADGTQPRHDD